MLGAQFLLIVGLSASLLLVPHLSFAQKQRHTSNSKPSLLEKSRRLALHDQVLLGQAPFLKNLDVSPRCRRNLIQSLKIYNTWFVENYENYLDMSLALDKEVREVNSQLSQVRGLLVATLSLRSQEVDEVTVNLDTIINYLRFFNERFVSSRQENQTELLEQLEDPQTNRLKDASGKPVGLTLDQIKTALQMMNSVLSASLKSEPDNTRIELTLNRNLMTFQLSLRKKILFRQKELGFYSNLLTVKHAGESNDFIGEQEKWRSLLSYNDLLINGMNINPLKRYVGILNGILPSTCIFENDLNVLFGKQMLNLPYQSIEAILNKLGRYRE